MDVNFVRGLKMWEKDLLVRHGSTFRLFKVISKLTIDEVKRTEIYKIGWCGGMSPASLCDLLLLWRCTGNSCGVIV